MVEGKMKRNAGSTAGSSYSYGLSRGEDIEQYSDKLKVMEEWSYFEDPDMRPRFMQTLGKLKTFSRTQWTIQASIG